MSFNISTRKEDVSMKLKTQNMKSTRHMTKKLELESAKMEERLQELKMAMSREKEERERQGSGGFWRSGQQGGIGGYAQDVLTSKASSAKSNREKSGGRRMKVKVLKDEPIVTPQRSKQPGTMRHLADRDLPNRQPPTKSKGPKCGQCETKGAQVSCMECGEDYCAGCFASFHLKGALKKHRSMPVGTNGMRRSFSPMPAAPVIARRAEVYEAGGEDHSGAAAAADFRSSITYSQPSEMNGGDGSQSGASQGHSTSALLNGQYDESESAASFQEALKAWRVAKGAERQGGTSSQQSNRAPAQAQTPRVESGTSTMEEEQRPIEIKFKSQSLTYAEKLLLKKHRRTDLGPLPDSESSPLSPMFDTQQLSSRKQDAYNRVDEELNAELNRVDFQALSQSVREIVPSEEYESGEVELRTESRVSIIDLNDEQPSYSLRGMEHSSSYDVKEIPDEPIPQRSPVPHTRDGAFNSPSPQPPTQKPSTPKSSRLARARRSAKTPPTPVPITPTPIVPLEKNFALHDDLSFMKKTFDLEDELKRLKERREKSQVIKSIDLTLPMGFNDGKENRPKSVKSRPSSIINSSRANSGTSSRAASRAASRAGSRAASRAGSRPQSRAASNLSIFGEGLLTKKPSAALKEVAMLAGHVQAPDLHYKADLSDFFTAGVKPMNQERVMTPSGRRSQQGKDEKWKVSNKLYTMGPRSWRPDSSLGGTVNDGQVAAHLDETVSTDVMNFLNPNTDEDAEREATVAFSLTSQTSTSPPTNTANTNVKYTKYSDAEKIGRGSKMSARSSTPRSSYSRGSATPRPTSVRDSVTPRPTSVRDSVTPRPTSVRYSLTPKAESVRDSLTPRPMSVRDSVTPRAMSVRDSVTPRAMSVRDSITPRAITPNMMLQRPVTPRTPRPMTASTRAESRADSRPSSRTIVVDGSDLSQYDEDIYMMKAEQDGDDNSALGQLHWELASQDGHATDDGKLSSLSMLEDEELGITLDDGQASGLTTPDVDTGMDINNHLRESDFMDDFEEMEKQIMQNEVKALH